jgi:hypothetical protein
LICELYKGISVRHGFEYLGGTPKIYGSVGVRREVEWYVYYDFFMRREDGVASKVLSNDKIGREPLKQFPDKFNSSLNDQFEASSRSYVVCTYYGT